MIISWYLSFILVLPNGTTQDLSLEKGFDSRNDCAYNAAQMVLNIKDGSGFKFICDVKKHEIKDGKLK